MKTAKMFLILCALLPAFGQTADDILAKNVAAMGGAESVQDIKSYTIQGVATAMNGMVVKLEIFSKGEKIYSKQRIESMGADMIMGFDGTDCYMQDPYMGLRLLSGQEKEQQIQNNDFTSFLDWKNLYAKRELKGETTVEGKPAYKVFVQTKSGMSMTNYIDKNTYMALRTDFTVAGAMGEMSGEVYFDEYQTVHKNFKIPVKMRTKVMGMEMKTVLDKVEINVEIPDSKFKLPEGLKK